jgi:hypothetical protein
LLDYARVLERSSMRRVIEATNVAFDRALSAAAIELGRRVGESTKPAATRIDSQLAFAAADRPARKAAHP